MVDNLGCLKSIGKNDQCIHVQMVVITYNRTRGVYHLGSDPVGPLVVAGYCTPLRHWFCTKCSTRHANLTIRGLSVWISHTEEVMEYNDFDYYIIHFMSMIFYIKILSVLFSELCFNCFQKVLVFSNGVILKTTLSKFTQNAY